MAKRKNEVWTTTLGVSLRWMELTMDNTMVDENLLDATFHEFLVQSVNSNRWVLLVKSVNRGFVDEIFERRPRNFLSSMLLSTGKPAP